MNQTSQKLQWFNLFCSFFQVRPFLEIHYDLDSKASGSKERISWIITIQDIYWSYFEKWMFMRVCSILLSCVYVGQVKMVQKITRQQVEVREATHYVHTHRQKAPNSSLTQEPLKVWTEHFHFMLLHWGAQTYQFLTDYRWPLTPTSDKGNILNLLSFDLGHCKCKNWPCYFLWNA